MAVVKLPLAQWAAAMNTHAAERAKRACHVANGVRIIGHQDFADGIARKVTELSNGDQRHTFYCSGDDGTGVRSAAATAAAFARAERPMPV
jgi:hypothetical protein